LVKIGDGNSITNTNVPNFIEIARINNGNITISDTNAGSSMYNILGDRLAQRTFEESGNYVSKRYDLQLRNKTTKDNPYVTAHMSDGVAYVAGYRHSLNFNSTFDIKKGRDTIKETIRVNNTHGDNYLILHDAADFNNPSNRENANGLFVIGPDAEGIDISDVYGKRGAAVSIHSVPKHIVEQYSLTDEWKWKSTLVGTARPFQFLYDEQASTKSADWGRTGSSYDLYLSDYKSSNVSNAVSVDNIIKLNSGYVNTTGYGNFLFDTKTHGITTEDRVSISGFSSDALNLDFYPVNFANSTHIVIYDTSLPATTIFTDGGALYRTTGNLSPSRTVVLDTYSSAAWNGSYIGGTIVLEGSSPKKIIDYIGTDAAATANYSSQQGVGWSRAGMVIVDSDFDTIPQYGNTYTINLPMSQARSVVYNHNISATGAGQYPAVLNQSWNVDPISGVEGSKDKLSNRVYGNRVDGDTGYNKYGNSPAGEDALLFDIGRVAVKSVTTTGDISAGFTGDTTFYYMENDVKNSASTGKSLDFAPSPAINHNFFGRPKPYPYQDTTISDIKEIKRNFILVNRTTGQLLTEDIANIVVTISTYNIEVTLTDKDFVTGEYYSLYFPVKAETAKPAYKKLIKANTTYSGKALQDLTDYANGHVLFQEGTYSTTAGSKFNLGKPDALRIHKVIKDIRNTELGINGPDGDIANTLLDITSSFTFDNGQRDSFYDNASLILKSNVNAPTGNVLVIFDRFERVDNPKSGSQTEDLSSPGFFSVDSYQYTTDLTLDHAPNIGINFTTGMQIKSNNETTAYVLDYANTASYDAKVRVQDVRGINGVTEPKFIVGETITGFNENGDTVSAVITNVVEADLKYSEIPEYNSPSGKIYPLRNMIDARPYVVTSDRVSQTLANSMTSFIPSASRHKVGRSSFANPMETTVISDSFAGRIDKIIVTKDGDYLSDPGVPSFQKYAPKDRDPKEALTLFTINIPPYTFDPRDIQIRENPALRHTMGDIGRLARRVENLEYYVSLTMLEQQMSELDITDQDGFSRFKNGIIVDNFNSDSLISKTDSILSIGKGELRPRQLYHTRKDSVSDENTEKSPRIKFTAHTVSSGASIYNKFYDSALGDFNEDGERILFDYTTTSMITQPLATTSESVNPFDVQNYVGSLSLTPDIDHWFDVTKIPEYSALLNTVFEVITDLSEANSSTDEIINAMLTMDDFWNEMVGRSSLGDDITTPGIHFETPTQSAEIERNIELGMVSGQSARFWTTAELDAAIANHGVYDGMIKSLKIHPYIRSRDVILDARGLKPNHLAISKFDGTVIENHFARATEIYMNYDPRTASVLFQPDQNDKYEKIKLTSGSYTANAILLAVREPVHLSDPVLASSGSRYMIGYIVPVFDEETGKVDYTTYKDGYYDTNWNSESVIKSHGWQGTNTPRTITGYKSGATATLIGAGTQIHYYNGHYTGTARNLSSNTSHIILSGDGHRYRLQNFQKNPSAAQERESGYPERTYVSIVSGSGEGQQAIVDSIIDENTEAPILKLRGDGFTTSIDGTSVYTISMKPVSPRDTRYAVSQIGDYSGKTNHYGEKLGILRIPSNDRVKFTTGRKLVELSDRYSEQAWKITNYASGYYEAAGQTREEVSLDLTPDRLNLLTEIRSQIGAFRAFEDHPDDLGYIPARTAGQQEYGKLAVVTGISFDHASANGKWTATDTDGITFVAGSAAIGTVDNAQQDHLRDNFNTTWKSIRDNYPDVYNKFYRGYFDPWILDE